MITQITDIAFEQISGVYHYGAYGPFKVIMNIDTGYINATHLCSLAENKNGGRKEFRNWKDTMASIEILEELSSGEKTPGTLLVLPTDLPNELRGTYAHPDLIPHIASWASPKFAVMVSRIVNAHLVREYKESIRVKDQTIDRLEQKIDDQSRQIAELLGYAKDTKSTLDHVVSQNDSLLQESRETSIAVECLEYQVDRATEAIEIILPNKTVTPPSDSVQFFCVYAHSLSATRFYAVRGQQANLTRTSAKLAKSGYILAPIYSREDPNPFHSFNMLKRLLDEGARALLQRKKARGVYSLKNAIEEFGSYRLNTIACSRDRLDSLLERLDQLRASMDQ